MFDHLRRFYFCAFVAPTIDAENKREDMPTAGAIYRINDGDPFPPKHTVRVLDVKDGWVRYYIGRCFNDERMRADKFLKCYRRC